MRYSTLRTHSLLIHTSFYPIPITLNGRQPIQKQRIREVASLLDLTGDDSGIHSGKVIFGIKATISQRRENCRNMRMRGGKDVSSVARTRVGGSLYMFVIGKQIP